MQAGKLLPDPDESGVFVEAVRLDRQPRSLVAVMAGVSLVVPSGFQQMPVGSYVYTQRNDEGTRVLARSYVLTQNWRSRFSLDTLSIVTWAKPGSGVITVQYSAGLYAVPRAFEESSLLGAHVESLVDVMGPELADAVMTMRSLS